MNILDPKFHYIDSYSTDLRKTFARVRREMRRQAVTPAPRADSAVKVTPIFRTQRPAA